VGNVRGNALVYFGSEAPVKSTIMGMVHAYHKMILHCVPYSVGLNQRWLMKLIAVKAVIRKCFLLTATALRATRCS